MKTKLLIGWVLVTLIFCLSFREQSFAAPEGNAAPDFTLSTAGGSTSSLSDYKGKANVILMFWTINGMYCSYELEGLRDRYAELQKNGFEVIAMNIKEQGAKVQNFVSEEKIQFPVLLDTDGKVSKMYAVRGLPVFLIIDKQGQIKWRGYRFPAGYLKYV